MSRGLLLSAVLAWSAFGGQNAAATECRNALAGDASSYAPWHVPASSVSVLRDVYRRISLATNTFPRFVLCDSNEFYAGYFFAPRAVVLTTRVLGEFSQKPDELASVVAHEFAHGELAHGDRGTAAKTAALGEEIRVAEAQVLAGGNFEAIIAHARSELRAYAAAVDRDLESEADERGVGIAVLAKFDAAGAKAALTRLADIEGRVTFNEFSDHPQTRERIADVEQLARNERYRAEAQRDVAAGRSLSGTVRAWHKEVPGSGALAFYEGVDRLQSRRNYAAEAFGDAVANYMGEGGISYVAQMHQEEAQSATLALCTSLYEAEQSVTALHCVKRLSAEDRRKFDEWARPKSVLITDKRNAETLHGLYSGRSAHTGVVKITNCRSEAARDDLRPIELWRPSHLQQVRGTDSLEACDASLCNCRRLDANFSGELERAER